MGSKPILVDLFCGAGGCTKGYQRAGFYVIGVDSNPQPNYIGDEFYRWMPLSFCTGIAEMFQRIRPARRARRIVI